MKFVGDAICLSGSAGSALKCRSLGQYYPFWWGIASGGKSRGHRNYTSIVELNAATGEVNNEETGETLFDITCLKGGLQEFEVLNEVKA